MAKTLAERLRDCAQGVSLGADGMGWSPDPALLEEAADKIVSLHAELQQARDGLTKGRNRMREDIERLTLELKEARESAERQTLEDAARIQALAREAHTWWTAARDAAKAERARCALRVALHSQYPIETDYDRGCDKARKDAAETLRTMGDDAGLELGPN